MVSERPRLEDTRQAFDRVAADYDGPAGNNALIQRMRACMWDMLTATFPPGARLLDLGCGTGIDAAFLAGRGYRVVATDWSPAMVERTRARIASRGLEARASVHLLGAHEIDRLRDAPLGGSFDGIYSDLGPLNCVPDLTAVSRACATLLLPGGRMVVSVMGRVCPWETAYYLARGQWQRASLRWRRGAVPVPLDGETVWTRYYTPREFYAACAAEFELTSYRGLRIAAPPPYMVSVDERFPRLCALAERLDDRLGALPVVRNAGDHFLMVLTKRD
jgi:SAM-dependent methyltransferase